MADTIKDNLEIIKKNVGLSNRFKLNINPPAFMNKDVKDFQCFVRNISLPSVNVNLLEEKYANRKYWAPIGSDIDTINITLFETKALYWNMFFREWINESTQFETGKSLKYYPADIIGSFDYFINNKQIKLDEIYPISIGDTSTSYDSSDDILNFNLTCKIKKVQFI